MPMTFTIYNYKYIAERLEIITIFKATELNTFARTLALPSLILEISNVSITCKSGNYGLNGARGLQPNLCAATSSVFDECEPGPEYLNDNLRSYNDDPQILQHLILLIILLCSTLFDLALSFRTMIMEEMIYAELAFLNVAFNCTQELIVLEIFDLDPSLTKLRPWLMKIGQD
ncbi:hypothetical protein HCN44_011067 [Aphidius gifuensis]|uniref:Uncharacterized protein n=1 Tax=Aphidius gifuensis TaxID=684658 RepID=A0A834XI22_APHGI|nr:hypothetical protein HCN44_011067 [Aphidius gifuensis]